MVRKVILFLFLILLFLSGVFVALSVVSIPDKVSYGATFSKFRADELNLDWKETYEALVYDMNIKHFRFVAHWPMVEPKDDAFDFSVLDYQMRIAEEEGADVILAVGKRLPSWPECHVPEWVPSLSEEEQNEQQLQYVQAVVERYKDSPALRMWQVENEPFIIGFAYENCGTTSIDFLESEIAFVRSLDPHHPILLTASGELGVWNGTWERADVFGTTLYRSVWNADLNMYITYPTTPSFFRAKRRVTELTTGEKKPAILAELAAEPWPTKAIIDTSLDEQLQRMNVDLFDETIQFAARTSFSSQYLWGAEWWYYLKKVHANDSMWKRAKELFNTNL